MKPTDYPPIEGPSFMEWFLVVSSIVMSTIALTINFTNWNW